MARFRVLSLDGGGIRGAFAAAFLARVEEQLDEPIARYFDLIVGTSTGGLIAAALGIDKSAAEICKLYETEGRDIFRRPRGLMSRCLDAAIRCVPRLGICRALQCKYTQDGLRTLANGLFGTRTLGSVRITRVALTSVDLRCGKQVVFKTPHLPEMIRDPHRQIADAVLATCAAPTYFPHAVIERGTAFCDGGVWANNPSLVGYAEAVRVAQECQRTNIDPCFDREDIHILSVGSGSHRYYYNPPENAGLLWWGPKIVDFLFTTQSQGVISTAKYLLGARYHRMDFELPDPSWSLDAVEKLDELIHLGRERATEEFAMLRPLFFDEPTSPYTPFLALDSQQSEQPELAIR